MNSRGSSGRLATRSRIRSIVAIGSVTTIGALAFLLQKILGHAYPKMTLRYAHLAPQYLRDEIARTERPVPAAAKTTHEPATEATVRRLHSNSLS